MTAHDSSEKKRKRNTDQEEQHRAEKKEKKEKRKSRASKTDGLLELHDVGGAQRTPEEAERSNRVAEETGSRKNQKSKGNSKKIKNAEATVTPELDEMDLDGAGGLTSEPKGAEGPGQRLQTESDQRISKGIVEKDNVADTEENEAKHTTIFSKFRKAVKVGTEKQPTKVTDERTDPVKLRDLVPIPQPQQSTDVPAVPSFSALPSWLTQPVKVSPQATRPFRDLGVDHDTIEHLTAKGFKEALPVQTAVLPLLLPIPSQHAGDLCVSAATGSGKTLSYALSITQDLKGSGTTSLRAIIVVPTRELVSQVQEVTRICASGTGLQVGTAVGSHALKSEQDLLVRKGRRYDPAGYAVLKEKLDKRVSWQNPDSEDENDGYEEDGLESRDDLLDAMDILPDHVPEFTSKVDILICTPGRLVEHLHSTRGFSLQHLRWLIIDEADRLLDQSFQEWAATLNKALEAASYQHKSLLANSMFPYSHLDQLQDRVRKVILSATMTRDLDKLGSLKLWNPRLVVVEGDDNVTSVDRADTITELSQIMSTFTLPATLEEHALPVSDGSEKPLYLLQLLLEHMSFGKASSSTPAKTITTLVAARASTSSDESSSDSSSDSSLSDSDTESGSVTDSSSDSASTSSKSSVSDGESDTSSSSTSASSSKSSNLPSTTPTDTQPQAQSNPANVLIFTSSTESATRLTHLLTTLCPSLRSVTANLTKSTSTSSTRRMLSQFQSGSLRIIIATDRASRGLDLPGLAHVVNYDVPRSLTSYLHRVGRTARAGNAGKAWTLVDEREARWFWNSIARAKEIDRLGKKVARSRVDVEHGVAFEPAMKDRYVDALEVLKRDVQGRSATA